MSNEISDVSANKQLDEPRWYLGAAVIVAALEDIPEGYKEISGYCYFAELIAYLCLNHGGKRVDIPRIPLRPEVQKLKDGIVRTDDKMIFVPGEPGRRDRNVARIWRNNPEKYKIVRGYALTKDQIWVSWEWLVDDQENVIETIEPKLLYFGKEMRRQDAKRFVEDALL
jgi:hypothetical protein